MERLHRATGALELSHDFIRVRESLTARRISVELRSRTLRMSSRTPPRSNVEDVVTNGGKSSRNHTHSAAIKISASSKRERRYVLKRITRNFIHSNSASRATRFPIQSSPRSATRREAPSPVPFHSVRYSFVSRSRTPRCTSVNTNVRAERRAREPALPHARAQLQDALARPRVPFAPGAPSAPPRPPTPSRTPSTPRRRTHRRRRTDPPPRPRPRARRVRRRPSARRPRIPTRSSCTLCDSEPSAARCRTRTRFVLCLCPHPAQASRASAAVARGVARHRVAPCGVDGVARLSDRVFEVLSRARRASSLTRALGMRRALAAVARGRPRVRAVASPRVRRRRAPPSRATRRRRRRTRDATLRRGRRDGARNATPRRARELGAVYNDWTKDEVRALYARPLLELVFDAAKTHRMHHDPRQVQQCTLLSIKTGGCPETCNYCAQSSSVEGGDEIEGGKADGRRAR